MTRAVPPICLEVAKRFEGWMPNPYRDVGGNWTIGYGHLISDPADPLMQATLTEQQGEALLLEDLQHAASELAGLPGDIEQMSESRYAAILDFSFNVGVGLFAGSTIHKLIEQGSLGAVGEQFARWDYVHGKIVEGLERRRDVEWLLWTIDADLGGAA